MSPTDSDLTTATLAFARTLATLSDDALVRDWPQQSAAGDFWSGYDDTAREIAYRVYLQLHDLAAAIASQRPAASEAQQILAQHQRAYRDLIGALLAAKDADFDREPRPGEWSLRTIVHHVTLAERGFHALIHWAVRRTRGGNQLEIAMPDDFRDEVSDPITNHQTLGEAVQQFDRLHQRVLADFVNLDLADLDAPNIWWEGYEIPARFRLHRFHTHLREHTIQIEKTLVWLDRTPTESQRLARMIHGALSEVEGRLLGAPATCLAQQRAIIESIRAATIGLQSVDVI